MEVGIVYNEKKEREMERGGYIILFCIFNYPFIYYCVHTQQYTVGLNKKVLSGFDVVLVVHVKHVVRGIELSRMYGKKVNYSEILFVKDKKE